MQTMTMALFRALMMALLAAPLVAAAEPPPTHASWCASAAHQTLSINGTVKQSRTFSLCLDSTPGSLRWASNVSGHQQAFNGTTRFDLTPNASAPQGVDCVATYFGPPPAGAEPWSFVLVDGNATFNRTEHNVDGFRDVGVWSVYRPPKSHGPFKIQGQWMEWRIENTSSTPAKEFLSTTCTQKAFPPSPPGVIQAGVRDFSGGYQTPAPQGAFEPPKGVKCHPAPGSKPMVPDDHCGTCPSGSLCCKDPDAKSGYCLGVKSCSQIHGGPPDGKRAAAWDAAEPMHDLKLWGA